MKIIYLTKREDATHQTTCALHFYKRRKFQPRMGWFYSCHTMYSALRAIEDDDDRSQLIAAANERATICFNGRGSEQQRQLRQRKPCNVERNCAVRSRQLSLSNFADIILKTFLTTFELERQKNKKSQLWTVSHMRLLILNTKNNDDEVYMIPLRYYSLKISTYLFY